MNQELKNDLVSSVVAPQNSLAERLLNVLLGSNISPGERLPAERQLTEMLGVGRSAVREALSALELLGVVEIRPGSGTYLRGEASELLSQSLSWSLLLDTEQVDDLVEVRSMLECSAASKASLDQNSAMLTALEEAVKEQRINSHDPAKFITADLKFHKIIASMTHNKVLDQMLSTSRSLLRVWVERSVHVEDDIKQAIIEHQEVFEAIASGNPQTAYDAMQKHMLTASARLKKASQESI